MRRFAFIVATNRSATLGLLQFAQLGRARALDTSSWKIGLPKICRSFSGLSARAAARSG